MQQVDRNVVWKIILLPMEAQNVMWNCTEYWNETTVELYLS